ncbi:hypothetical protein ACFE04_030430 [Oxalis oulophora]
MKSSRKLREGIERLKEDANKIREDQRCIREEQVKMREKLEEIRNDCEFIKNEAEEITQLSQRTQSRLDLIFLILDARKNNDFVKANIYSTALRLLLNNNNNNTSSDHSDDDHNNNVCIFGYVSMYTSYVLNYYSLVMY